MVVMWLTAVTSPPNFNSTGREYISIKIVKKVELRNNNAGMEANGKTKR